MLEKITIKSQLLNSTSTVFIYIPDGYQRERYPVIYLFRADAEEWLNPSQDETRKGRTAITVLNDLLYKGYIGPTALVFPTTANVEKNIFSGGFDFFAPPSENIKNIGTGKFEQFFMQELMFELEKSFPIGGKPSMRALGGFSIGGLFSFVLGLKHPDTFSAISSYDASFLYWNFDHPDGVGHKQSDLRLDFAPYWFGIPPNFSHFQKNNPANILFDSVGTHLAKIKRLPMYIQHASDHCPNTNQWRVERFLRMLSDVKIANGFDRALLSGHAKHSWYWVDEYLYCVIPQLCQHMHT